VLILPANTVVPAFMGMLPTFALYAWHISPAEKKRSPTGEAIFPGGEHFSSLQGGRHCYAEVMRSVQCPADVSRCRAQVALRPDDVVWMAHRRVSVHLQLK
jgi:hypothetical protein